MNVMLLIVVSKIEFLATVLVPWPFQYRNHRRLTKKFKKMECFFRSTNNPLSTCYIPTWNSKWKLFDVKFKVLPTYFMSFIISKNTKITKATIDEAKFKNLSRIVLLICYFLKLHVTSWNFISYDSSFSFVHERWMWSIMLKFGYKLVQLKTSLGLIYFRSWRKTVDEKL